jgi:hypothetical protein
MLAKGTSSCPNHENLNFSRFIEIILNRRLNQKKCYHFFRPYNSWKLTRIDRMIFILMIGSSWIYVGKILSHRLLILIAWLSLFLFYQATFKGWIEIMADAADSKDVFSVFEWYIIFCPLLFFRLMSNRKVKRMFIFLFILFYLLYLVHFLH